MKTASSGIWTQVATFFSNNDDDDTSGNSMFYLFFLAFYLIYFLLGLVPLFNGISNFIGYLMSKLYK